MKFLAILKPDGVLRKAAGAGILKGLLDSNSCYFESFRKVIIPKRLLDIHYNHVRERDFYPWLINYMSTFESYVILLDADETKIDSLRHLLGKTRSHEADKSTLRYMYCPYGGANGLHLSEDVEAGLFETNLWKQSLGIMEGDFDIPIEEYIQNNIDKVNNTFKLRGILSEVASNHCCSINQEKELVNLFAEECENKNENATKFLFDVYTKPLLN